MRNKYKPFQNNNVINEHGVASNAIGVSKIIGVLNNAYGSPNENPQNIPFDIRHMRFPIEYLYSIRTKKSDARDELVGKLKNAIRDTAIFALQSQKSKFLPFAVWSEWERNIPLLQKFIPAEKTEEIKKMVLEAVSKGGQTVRILGLSGLGKTRILLEMFRPVAEDSTSVFLSSRILYVNCNLNPNTDYQQIFSKIAAEQADHIIIMDNCPLQTLRQVLHFINREATRLSLITIDSNPEEIESDRISSTNYILLKKEELTNVIDEILSRDFNNIGKDNIDKVREFSQGIPLMAVLLGESVKNGEKFIGKLDDKELLDKLLGERGKQEKHRTILKSCSIFNYFGFYDDLESQSEFIALNKNITSLSGDDQVIINDFNETCNYYLKREIFEKRGRYIGMRPFPLAISLAQEWLEPCTPKRLLDVITQIAQLNEPHRANLSEALAEQMKYLGYNNKAIEIIDKITGPNSPFYNAEVLNTELGSRLFRSFVEVNPIAIGNALTRVFGNKSTEQLLKIGAGRRNIVWLLEKLSFDKRTFTLGARLLYDFAIAENENWANNATGQFLQLFNIILPGTEATLAERWAIINWGLQKDEEKYTELAIKAMSTGLKYGHFNRMGGAERQGSKVLEDNTPTWEEVKKYWVNILDEFLKLILSKSKYKDIASKSIANSIRSITKVGLGHILIPYIDEVSKAKNFDWDEALIGLKSAKKYESKSISPALAVEIDRQIETLTKRDFLTRYTNLNGNYLLQSDEPYSSDKFLQKIEDLAKEFVETNVPWYEILPSLYGSATINSFHFGRHLYLLYSSNEAQVSKFIEISLDIIDTIEPSRRNVTLLGGFIFESSDKIKEGFYSRIYLLERLRYLLFYFVSLDINGSKYMNLLFQLTDENVCELSEFRVFDFSNALTHFNSETLKSFSKRLFSYGEKGSLLVFDLLFNFIYDKKDDKEVLPIIKESLYKIGVLKGGYNRMDDFKWSHAISIVLSDQNETEFAQFINRSIIKVVGKIEYHYLEDTFQRIYERLISVHFSSIWPELSIALLSKEDEYMTFFALKGILGSHIGGIRGSIGMLFKGDIEEIFRWCQNNKLIAAARLAELAPVFDNNNTDYSNLHPIARRLIDEYGENLDVLSSLSANMGSYSWTGSVVPYLVAKKKLFGKLREHRIKTVADWAGAHFDYLTKEIELEKNRDAESFLN